MEKLTELVELARKGPVGTLAVAGGHDRILFRQPDGPRARASLTWFL